MASEIVYEDLNLPGSNKNKLAFLLHNVVSEEECKEYIKKTEKMGYEEALVNTGFGRQKMMTDVRNSSRCIWDSEAEANKLWDRVKKYVPEVFEGRKVIGLNERLRFLRYDHGEYFKPHFDGEYRRANGERSCITLQLYLNEGFEGGETTFFTGFDEHPVPVVPKTGMVLIFEHMILHEGSTLISGRKYSMRTDVMYSGGRLPQPPTEIRH